MYSTFWPKKWTIYIYSIVHTQSATMPVALGKQESMGGSLSGSFWRRRRIIRPSLLLQSSFQQSSLLLHSTWRWMRSWWRWWIALLPGKSLGGAAAWHRRRREAAAEAGKAGSAFCSRAAAGRSCCWEWRLLLHCCPSLHSLLHSGRFAAHPPVVLHGVLQARTWKARQCEVDGITTFRDFLLWHFARMSTPVISCHLKGRQQETLRQWGHHWAENLHWERTTCTTSTSTTCTTRVEWKMWNAAIWALHDTPDQLWPVLLLSPAMLCCHHVLSWQHHICSYLLMLLPKLWQPELMHASPLKTFYACWHRVWQLSFCCNPVQKQC